MNANQLQLTRRTTTLTSLKENSCVRSTLVLTLWFAAPAAKRNESLVAASTASSYSSQKRCVVGRDLWRNAQYTDAAVESQCDLFILVEKERTYGAPPRCEDRTMYF
jgi:hypothetical protein